MIDKSGFVDRDKRASGKGIARWYRRRLKLDRVWVLTNVQDVMKRGLTPIALWGTQGNVVVNICDRTFDPGYLEPRRQRFRFYNDVLLSSILVHEWIHARRQGFVTAKCFPNYMEDEAYGFQLRYLQRLRKVYGSKERLGDINDVVAPFFGGGPD